MDPPLVRATPVIKQNLGQVKGVVVRFLKGVFHYFLIGEDKTRLVPFGKPDLTRMANQTGLVWKNTVSQETDLKVGTPQQKEGRLEYPGCLHGRDHQPWKYRQDQ